MNLANKITMARIIMVPFFIFFLLARLIPFNFLWALIIFVVASISDAIDGKIARKNNMVTNFGKFLDPLADKILVLSALVCFIQMRLAGAIMVIIIIGRELMVTSLRMTASSQGEVIAANIWGKIKTVSQMIAIIYTLVYLSFNQFTESVISTGYFSGLGFLISKYLLWISTILTLVSGIIYFVQNKSFLKSKD